MLSPESEKQAPGDYRFAKRHDGMLKGAE